MLSIGSPANSTTTSFGRRPGLVGRSALHDLADERALLDAELLRRFRRDVAAGDAEPRMRRTSGVHELLGDRNGDVDRDRERDTLGPHLGARGDRGVDADDGAGRVDERAAGVALRDRCVRLDHVEQRRLRSDVRPDVRGPR